MFGKRPFRPSHATVVAYLALFVALGGTALAATSLPANSVGTRQLRDSAVSTSKLRNQAVTGSKVANNSLTGTQIKASTLGTVPNAAHAVNADRLAGSPGSSYRDHCPKGLDLAPGTNLCFEVTPRTPADWATALATCALAGLHLPAPGELAQVFNDSDAVQNYQWTSDISDGGSGTGPYATVAMGENAMRQVILENLPGATNQRANLQTVPYRCVTAASN
jgi:hypothetical protein